MLPCCYAGQGPPISQNGTAAQLYYATAARTGLGIGMEMEMEMLAGLGWPGLAGTAGTFETGMVLADRPWRLGCCQRSLTMFILLLLGEKGGGEEECVLFPPSVCLRHGRKHLVHQRYGGLTIGKAAMDSTKAPKKSVEREAETASKCGDEWGKWQVCPALAQP